jgi:hypothetical protein
MIILGWGLFIFIIGLSLHFLVWKVHLPKRQVKTFLQIFFLVLFFFLLGLIWAGKVFPSSSILPHGIWELVHISVLTISIILAYMMSYPGIEGDSPSLVIVIAISNAGPEGLEKTILKQNLNDDLLVRPRVRDLLLDKMAYSKGGKYFLTTKGKVMARIFIFYRNLLYLPKGG